MSQTSLDFSATRFAGDDYKPARDKDRLVTQIQRIHAFMSDGKWHTLSVISMATGAPEASVSANLRNLRKKPHCLTIEKRHVGDGLYEYRLA